MPTLDTMTVNLKINPEMSDEAKLILREMIVTELKAVFPDTIKPFEMLREEMRVMVKKEIDAYFEHSMKAVRTQVGRKHSE
jgi:hypothetical protein